MVDKRQTHRGFRPQPSPPAQPRRATHWSAVTDWLGAQKPLNLIAGMIALIALCSVLLHLVRT